MTRKKKQKAPKHHAHISRQVITPTAKNRRKRPAVGFQVHLPRYGLTKWFLISTRRGEKASLKAAIAWRDAILQRPPTPDQIRSWKEKQAIAAARRAATLRID